MRSVMKLSKGLSLAVLAASLGVVGCGPDYAIYKVHVVAQRQDIDLINKCTMSIQNEKGEYVVRDLLLEQEYGSDSSGGLVLKQGCSGGMTKTDVGYFSYSTSRTGGSLKFIVSALGGPENQTLIQQGEGSEGVKAYPPEIKVDIVMSLQSNP